MSNFTAADVKKLRDLTGAGMMDCKKALEEAGGDFDKAVEILRIKGADLPPAVGVLVEYTGETDEAGDSDARGVAMQIAAMRPKYLTRDEVPADVVATERRIAEETAREEGKPEAALTKIVEGRVNAFFKDFVLLEQASVQDQKKSVRQILGEAGITLSRFVRFEVGQA